MSLYSLIPYFVAMAVLCGIFSLPVFRFVDATETSGKRVSTIDGLRGFLALSVMLYHGLINYNLVTGQGWHAAGKIFYNPLGGVAVMLFFMITAFLFWGRLLRSAGRPDWKALYINRFFRIAPLYVFTVLVMTFIVFWRCDFVLREPPVVLARNLGHWLAFGMDDSMPAINAFPLTPFILMGVTWSIKYEWYFYFSLVLTAVFVQLRSHMAFAVIGLIASLMIMMTAQAVEWSFVAAFFCGILTASLLHEGYRPRISDRSMSAISIISLLALFSFARTHDGVIQVALTGISFYLICSGASMFGILRLKSAERLGHISYGIYVMQGIPMNIAFGIAPFVVWATRTPVHYWLALLLCAGVLCVVSSITYALIERPFIAMGKSLGNIKSKRIPQPQPSEPGAFDRQRVASHE